MTNFEVIAMCVICIAYGIDEVVRYFYRAALEELKWKQIRKEVNNGNKKHH